MLLRTGNWGVDRHRAQPPTTKPPSAKHVTTRMVIRDPKEKDEG
jgi:hypothetical protein